MKQLSPYVDENFWKCKNPFYYKITENPSKKILYIYNYGCNWNCKICIYRFKTPYYREKLEIEKIKEIITEYSKRKRIKEVSFIGGEPLSNPNHKELMNVTYECGLRVVLGHTNLSKLPPQYISKLTVGIKAITEWKYNLYTGNKNSLKIFNNIRKALDMDTKIKANMVFVPGFIDADEVEKVAEKISEIDDNIQFHIIGYIPNPGFIANRRPSLEELKEAEEKARNYLKKVTSSLPEYPSYKIKLCSSTVVLPKKKT